jgi:hypothetical protein
MQGRAHEALRSHELWFIMPKRDEAVTDALEDRALQ